ncbi:hypothetical protein VT50_0214090 [Streptomyces antioxidans]|uniref:Major facilitator superfamily (MFS) profile domain-containing protein n=1 Tax=Streptomyces antioxidans TaxID=1507734 RepID=A0A1V4D685_9ACTN|nr:hypothetical protein [Streptomyces antioxidans]OPF80264.1 hypothetical protein VT50_0214090 [Streptomyces antioxidans]
MAALGFLGAQPVFWTVPPTILSGAHMAGTIALISGFGNLGGFLGPYLLGVAEPGTGSGATGLYAIAAILAAGVGEATTLRWVGTPITPSDPIEERTTDDTHRALRR